MEEGSDTCTPHICILKSVPRFIVLLCKTKIKVSYFLDKKHKIYASPTRPGYNSIYHNKAVIPEQTVLI